MKQADVLNNSNSYPLQESIGWFWRNIRGVKKTNLCGILPLPTETVLNSIQPQIILGFVGDIMAMGHKVLNISSDVLAFFQECDYLIGNMEGTITNSRKTSLDTQRHDPSIIDALTKLFEPDRFFLSVANNHAGDFPTAVFRQSVKLLRNEGFHVFGLCQEPIADIGDSVRVVAASMWSNRICGEILSLDALDKYCGSGPFSIAYPHWGYELEMYPRPEIVAGGEKLLSLYGAVVGHHSHVPQPLTIVRHDNTTKLLAFSLGDFCTGIRSKKFQYGIVCKVAIGRDQGETWQIGTVRWHYTMVLHEGASARVVFVNDLSL